MCERDAVNRTRNMWTQLTLRTLTLSVRRTGET